METEAIYPLEFSAQLFYRLWGGHQLKTRLGKKCNHPICGESWEISGLEGNVSVITNGPHQGKGLNELIAEYAEEILGHRVIQRFGKKFPLLIKFIDAQEPLSVQVHPNDALAQKRHNCWGKSEMWYILSATKNAALTLGFISPITRDDFLNHCQNKTLDSVLKKQKVNKGDVVNIPAGLLHAIGGGILLAEIQQASDVTYRVYDYDRIDAKKGKPRKLHQNEAVDAIDFSLGDPLIDYETSENSAVSLVESDYFSTHLIHVNGNYSCENASEDTFSVLIGVEGDVVLSYQQKTYSIGLGKTILLPAALGKYCLKGSGKVLVTTV